MGASATHPSKLSRAPHCAAFFITNPPPCRAYSSLAALTGEAIHPSGIFFPPPPYSITALLFEKRQRWIRFPNAGLPWRDIEIQRENTTSRRILRLTGFSLVCRKIDSFP